MLFANFNRKKSVRELFFDKKVVHKKYTYKDGKRFGPYYYETKRVNGNVVTTYLGNTNPGNDFFSKYNPLILIAFLLFSVAIILFVSFNITGHASLDIKTDYNVGELIEGRLNLNLVEGEFVPADSIVTISYAGTSKEFILSSLISESPTQGQFYAEGTSLTGEGSGYGITGKIKEYPFVDFEIQISSQGNEIEESQDVSEEIINEPVVEETQIDEPEIAEPNSETSQSSNSEPESPSITGSAVSDSVISGQVSSSEDFVYSLSEEETASLVEGSVYSDGNSLADSEVDLKIKKNELTVSTNYFVEKEGYGQEYVGNSKKKISIDLSFFDFIAIENSEISVVLDYNGLKIVETNDYISVVSESNETIEQIIINESVIGNLTIANETLVTNITGVVINESLVNVNVTQFSAIIGQPVRWIKTVAFDVNDTINLVVQIPASAENVSFNKIDLSEYAEIESLSDEEIASLTDSTKSDEIIEENISTSEIISEDLTIGITGEVTADFDTSKKSFLSRLLDKIFRFTGFAVEDIVSEQVQEVSVALDKNDFGVEVEYYTDAPVATESASSLTTKTVFVSSPSDVHYENVLVFTSLSDSLKLTSSKEVMVEWVENNSQKMKNLIMNDSNADGYYDSLGWIAPRLSNQTFNIIVIIDAQHLDENRTFISNIYNETSALDGIWSETITDGHYVRVTFETNLTSEKDITIWPRIVSGKPNVEVYEINSIIKIEEFNNIRYNQYNKIFLTNLNGTQDRFDLRVIGGSMEFDHIIDPTAAPNETKQLRAQTCDAMTDSESSNNYVNACLGTYPAQCISDLVSCNDGSFEDQNFLINTYAGIKITSFNNTITNCGSVTGVTLCYEWWARTNGPYSTCPLYVSNGVSEGNIGATCPTSVADPGRTCVNVTTTQNWTCGNFFGSSGTRAYVRTEVLNDIGDDQLRQDLLMFNVTYVENIPPGVFNLTSPINGTFTSVRAVNISLFVNDTDSSTGGNANLSLFYIDNGVPFTNEHLVFRKNSFAMGTSIYFNYSIPPLEYDPTGMILLYHFDNNTYYGENLTVITDFATSGKFNSTYLNSNGDREISRDGLGLAFEVDSNERIQLNDDALLDSPNVTGAITIIAWINMSTNVTSNANQFFPLVSKQTGSSNRSYLLDFSNSSKVMTFSTGNGTGSGSAVFFAGNTRIYPNISWYHVALTFNRSSGNATFYINGVPDKSQNFSTSSVGTLLDLSTALLIGGSNANSYFGGLIDDVAIYNRTLNASEVLDVYRLKEGVYYLRANITDPAGGSNSTNSTPIYTFFVDSTAPNVTLNNPDNASTFETSNTISFNWTAIDSIDSSMNCNLSIDNIINQTNIASTNNTMINRSVTGFSVATHYWNVTCLDDAANRGNSVTRTFTVTQSNRAPYNESVLVINSTTGTNKTFENLNVRTTLLDLDNNSMNVTVRWFRNSTLNLTFEYNSSYVNGTTFIATLGHFNTSRAEDWLAGLTINDGLSSFTVNSSNLTILDSAPNVTLISPGNNSISPNFTTQNFTWVMDDADDPEFITAIQINWSSLSAYAGCNDPNFNGATVYPFLDNRTSYAMSDASVKFECPSYLWSVQAQGTVLGPYAPYFRINFTGVEPNITLNSPANDSRFDFGSSISFNWTANDSTRNYPNGINSSCNLSIDNVINQTNVVSPNLTMVNRSVTGFSLGSHNWNVSCLDIFTNRGDSVIRTFRINNLPYNGTVLVINSTHSTNKTLDDLNVRTTLLDLNNHSTNVTVRWYNNSKQHLAFEYNSSYVNGTTFIATLGHFNTTKGQNWSVGITINDGIDSFTVNSSNITILNSLPNVTLLSPANNSVTLNRSTQAFSWAMSDDDGDGIVQDRINITLVATSTCTDSNFDGTDIYEPFESLGSYSFGINNVHIFRCLIDNGDRYVWSVAVSDDAGYGPYTSPFNITAQAYLNNVMNISLVEFGNLGYLKNNDTTDNLPKPLIIVNEGNALNDIVITATQLWRSVIIPSEYYRYKYANVTTNGLSENGSFSWGSSQTVYKNMTINSDPASDLINLNYTAATDSAEIDINITVPPSEGPGARSSTITFTITLGTGDQYAPGL